MYLNAGVCTFCDDGQFYNPSLATWQSKFTINNADSIHRMWVKLQQSVSVSAELLHMQQHPSVQSRSTQVCRRVSFKRSPHCVKFDPRSQSVTEARLLRESFVRVDPRARNTSQPVQKHQFAAVRAIQLCGCKQPECHSKNIPRRHTLLSTFTIDLLFAEFFSLWMLIFSSVTMCRRILSL